MKPKGTIAAAWYRREDYQKIYDLGRKGGGMEKTFDDWKEVADETMVQMAMQGIQVTRIVIDPDEFATWLKKTGQKSTGASRAEFATVKARQLDGAGES